MFNQMVSSLALLPGAWDISPLEFLTTYGYRITLIGTVIIGSCSGAMGCFLYLRKQSLLSDVVGHSAIFGVMTAFVVAQAILDIDGRSMAVLTVGALISSIMSVFLSDLIGRYTKLGQDAAMSICLALFYGLGITALYMITHSTIRNRGGIKDYMFGSTSSLTWNDIVTMFWLAVVVLGLILLLWKELKLFIFDPVQAEGMGFSSRILSPMLLALATISIVIGVKAVGLILMVAFAIMPAAAARQWCKTLPKMVLLAGCFGAFAAMSGVYLAINLGNVPSGPMTVVVLFAVFVFSLIAPPERSVLRRKINRRRIQNTLEEQLVVSHAKEGV